MTTLEEVKEQLDRIEGLLRGENRISDSLAKRMSRPRGETEEERKHRLRVEHRARLQRQLEELDSYVKEL